MLATAALAAAAPFCSVYFHEPPLTGLIWLVASGVLINALSSVPMARLYHQLDFRKIATAGLQYNLSVLVTTVTLAFLGFGAYSLLIPLPVFSAVRLIQFWRWAPSRIQWRLGLARWPVIARDAFPLAAGVLIYSLITAIPSVALGRIRTVADAGIFYFGWNLSTQALQLLGFNLMQVLLPVLTGLKNDLPRQAAALLRVLRLVVFISTPACAVVAVLAKPAVVMIFGAKWALSAQVLAILSIGTPFALIGNPLMSYLQARHRYSFSLYVALGMLAMAIPLAAGRSMASGRYPGGRGRYAAIRDWYSDRALSVHPRLCRWMAGSCFGVCTCAAAGSLGRAANLFGGLALARIGAEWGCECFGGNGVGWGYFLRFGDLGLPGGIR